MYLLPTSTTEALLEYTLFSHDLLPKEEYEQSKYIRKLGIHNFEIIEKKASIPMTCYPFGKKTTKRVLIGLPGGWTKASTGYTFKNSTRNQRSSFFKKRRICDNFIRKPSSGFYDLLLLDILNRHNELGASIDV
jgi:lycopene beta-cyclase